MTVTPIIGQDIGAAFRATRDVLDDLLERDGTSFLEWVTLRQLAAAHAPMARVDVVLALAPGGGDPHAAIAALAGSGDIVDDGTAVALTTAGDARYRALEAKVVDVVKLPLRRHRPPRHGHDQARAGGDHGPGDALPQLSATPP